MRVHRIAVRSYRGVDSCELTFAEQGVTVVEGDNEAGKSSLAEALHLIIEYRDDSTAKPVKAVRPLHLDAGAEVEVDISVGAVRFTYAKRWHRDRFTRLKVTSPAPEVLNGREAHDRVRELLAATVDLDLWRALSAPQADVLHQAPLRDHPSLVAALDAAAGGDLGNAEEGDLLALAEAEAARWSTPTGRPKAVLAERRERATETAAQVEACQQAIARLEADVAWHADRRQAAEDLAAQLTTATAAADEAQAHLLAVERRQAEVDALSVAAQLAVSRRSLAEGAVTARRAAIDAVAAATQASTAAQEQAGEVGAVGEVATAASAEAEAHAVTAGRARDTAEVDVETTGASHTQLRGLAALAEVEARLAEATRRQTDLDEATVALAANPSTPAALDEVQARHDAVVRAEAALAAGQASVRIDALADTAVEVDGAVAHLVAGTSTDHDVADALVLEVPGHLRLTVTAGADAHDLAVRLGQARGALTDRCSTLGVADLAGARTLEQERRVLASQVTDLRTALAATVAGASIADLTTLAAQARAALVGGPGERGLASVPTEAEVTAARARHDEAVAACRLAERAADRADADVAAARLAATNAKTATTAAVQRAEAAARRMDVLEADLATARTSADDTSLHHALEVAGASADAATASWREAAAGIAALDVEGSARTAQRTATERAGIERALHQAREDLAAIGSRLELQGEAGLADRLAEAERAAMAAAEDLASVEARAAAARCLVDTLVRHRDEAARAYGAPLQREIEDLGRPVFGPSFAVVLDDELRIAARVLDGVPVPWAELSVGAREQLAVLSRLAAASLVSPSGGVPVVFDDVLGFTDPGRLALVSGAFEVAASRCQIIVLTCDPQRYRHLARAVTHCLTTPRAIAERAAG